MRKLKQETFLRKALELKLKKSKAHYTDLLEKSRRMQEYLRHLSHQVLLAQEEERKKISRELHDEIAQTLAGINVHLATLKVEAAVNTDGLKKKITRTQRLVEKSVNIVHRFARELRPTLLDDLGLVPALRSYMKEFTQKTRIPVYFSSYSGIDRMNGDQRTALFRIAQSALTNIAQHAHASRVSIKLQKLSGTMRMMVQDNGRAFQVDHVLFHRKRKRLGLLGMRERVEMVGGSLAIDSVRGKGTTITAEIPIIKGQKELKDE